ncbi:MAG: HigA family addiction module antitoxin [Bryobacterales bacterium]|nr:HigA family addiction module antitoxin [Bryobacterales bacterium]
MTGRAKLREPIHPGEILLEEFIKPLGISMNRLARDLDVPPNRIGMIVNGARAITADTALRLGLHFSVSPELWLTLQVDYDLRVARRERRLKNRAKLPPDALRVSGFRSLSPK